MAEHRGVDPAQTMGEARMPLLHPALTAALILGYVGLQIAVGVWIGRRVRSSDEYYLAGRSLGVFPIAMSVFATWFGAETVLGSSAVIASEGLAGARAEPFGYALCLTAMAFLVATPFRRRGYMTLADFFRERFSRGTEIAAAAITILVSVIWAAAQLLAFSAILSVAFNLPALVTVIAAAVIVIVYASFGGLLSDVATDVVQGLILLAALLGVLVALAFALHGLNGLLGVITPEQLRLVGPGESPLARLDAWSIPILGSLVTQEAIARFAAARSPRVARDGCLGAAGLYLLAGAAPVLIALGGVHYVPLPEQTDQFLPVLVASLLGPVWSVLLMAALLSALLSTVDSNILSVSALTTNNLGKLSGKLWAARAATAAAGVTALGIAIATLATGDVIYDLIELSSTLGQAGLLVAVLAGLHLRFGGRWACWAAILACAACNLFTYVVYPQLAGDPEAELPGGFLLSVLAALLGYGIVGLLERPHSAGSAPAAPSPAS